MARLKRLRCYKVLTVPNSTGTVNDAMHQSGASAWTPQSMTDLSPTPSASGGPNMPPIRGKIVGIGIAKVSGGNYGASADVTVRITSAAGIQGEVTITPPTAGTAAELWGDLQNPIAYDAVGVTHHVYVAHSVVPVSDQEMAVILIIEDDWS